MSQTAVDDRYFQTERVWKILLRIAPPVMLAQLIQALYNIVDSYFVGQYSNSGLTALSVIFPVQLIITAIAVGTGVGVNTYMARMYAFGKKRAADCTAGTGMVLAVISWAVFAAAALLLMEPYVRTSATSSGAVADAVLYGNIVCVGSLGIFLESIWTKVHQAGGNMRLPMLAQIAGALTNIVLDLLFVIRFGMGVAGVAWATLIAQGLCAVASLLVLLRRMRRMPCEPEKQGVKLPLFHMVAVKRIAQIGLPSMLQQSLVSLSMMMMQGLVNSFGKVLVAGYTAATKIDSLAMLPNMNISNAMSSFTAQNIGAGKYERVKEGLKACLLMVAVFSLLITVIIFLFGNQLLSLFLDPGDASGAMGYGLAYMHTVSLFYILMGLLFVPNGMLRGAGDMAAFTFSSMANLFSRVGIAYALVYLTPLGANAIWWSIPAGWLIGAAVSLLRVKSGKWMRKAVADR